MAYTTTTLRLVKRLAAAGVLVLGVSAPAVAGFDEGSDAFARKDYKTAYKEFLPLARAGDVTAQFALGDMYDNGLGVPRDYAEAVKWYRKAAEQGYAKAQYNIGIMYDNGVGVRRDYAEAVKWYRKAAEQGLAGAQHNIGGMYAEGEGVRREYIKAHMWLSLAAAQGFKHAAKNRDIVAKRMTSADISKAQKMAREWKPKK